MKKTDAECCCCDNRMGAEVSDLLDKKLNSEDNYSGEVQLISSAESTFKMYENGKLTEASEALWNLHKEVIDATLYSGWDNSQHPWNRTIQTFWKYPLAFSTYAIPSLVMIDPTRREEACEYLRKSLLLFKDTPVWDGWTKQGYGDPVSNNNIMYKGHLNLIYGLYQLVSGSTEFEDEYKQLTKIIIDEYERNSHAEPPYWGICCEPDQYFTPCNSVGMMSMKIYDLNFGTDYDAYARKINAFFEERISDKETGLLFFRYHPSHQHTEASYFSGFGLAWALNLVHRYDKTHYEKVYKYFIDHFQYDLADGKISCLKEYANYDDISTAVEESMGTFYTTALTKEYNDPVTWEKFERYFISVYGMEIKNKVMRLTKATPTDETFVQNYLFYGNLHLGWNNIVRYDWRKGQMTK